MLALEQVAGKSKNPWVTLDPTTSLIEDVDAPTNKRRAEA